MNHLKAPYPLDSLPLLIAGAVKELCKHSNSPVELAAPLVLGVAPLVYKGAIDASSYQLYSFSESGTRKSTVLKELRFPILGLEHGREINIGA
jgi:hypothetical protein